MTPPTRYKKGRPDWWLRQDNRRVRQIDPSFEQGIVTVYYWNEWVKFRHPVPVDVIRVDSARKKPVVLLPPEGTFVYEYADSTYKVLYRFVDR